MESFQQCFAAVSEYCKSNMVETTYNLFIRSIEPVSFKNGVATLSVGSSFQRDVVSERYVDILKLGFREVLGFDVEIELVTAEETAEKQREPKQDTGEQAFTFDTFIVGLNNRFAYAAAQAVAASNDESKNPLFIYGPSGLGKTHLLLAIKNEVLKTRPNVKVEYIDGEAFTNELVSAMRFKGSTADFHETYRSLDVLLVDDIQFIAGKERTQEEFFHTYNALRSASRQIVLTSDRPPKDIQALDDRLRSRFEAGLMADISAPDFETKVAILKTRADAFGFELPDDVAKYIANHIKNIRQLIGTVKKLNAYRIMEGVQPSLGLAQNAIKDILSEQRPIPVTVAKIVEEVGRTFNISPDDLRSSKQNAAISSARQIAMYIIREVTGLTLEAVGDEFNRNYATVVYAIKRVEEQCETDTNLRHTIEDIIKNCRV